MGVVAKVINLDNLYLEYCSNNNTPLIINDFKLQNKDDYQAFNEKLITQYEGDTISSIPHCGCRKYNAAIFQNYVCEDCGDEVLSDLDRPIKMAAWMRVPDGVSYFINPIILTQLRNLFKKATFNAIDYVLDPHYRFSSTKDQTIQALINKKLPRGLNNFYNNWYQILESLLSRDITNLSQAKQAMELQYYKRQYERGLMFCKHMPNPSKVMFITEKSVYGTYADELMVDGIEPAKIISSIKNSASRLSEKSVLSRTARANIAMSEYHLDNWVGRWSTTNQSDGILRKHLYSTRTDWAMRLVLTSDQRLGVEEDEVSIPWAAGMAVFESHIASKLLQRGFTEIDINRIIESNTGNNNTIYKPLLKRIFKELLDECSYGAGYGIPAIFLRNPSLTRGSSQVLRITEVKDDCNDKTISANLLVFPAPNADLTN